MIIVLEGLDASGKGTQSQLLKDHLLSIGKSVCLYSFPAYNKTFASTDISKYLSGEYGSLKSLPSQFPALLYALDRFEISKQIPYDSNKIIIFDRYVPSNIAYQAAKLEDKEEKAKFIEWVYKLEYEILEMRKPDHIFLLNTPPKESYALRVKRDRLADIHEKDLSYLTCVYNEYLCLANSNKYGTWHLIESLKNGSMRDRQEILADITSFLEL